MQKTISALDQEILYRRNGPGPVRAYGKVVWKRQSDQCDRERGLTRAYPPRLRTACIRPSSEGGEQPIRGGLVVLPRDQGKGRHAILSITAIWTRASGAEDEFHGRFQAVSVTQLTRISPILKDRVRWQMGRMPCSCIRSTGVHDKYSTRTFFYVRA